MNLELLTWVKDGKYMIEVLKILAANPQLSSELAKRLGANRASMSRVLRGLKEHYLVSAISGKSRTVTYVITKKGSDLVKMLCGD